MQEAILGAGCFWHVEYDFSKVKGVIKTEVGYMGGEIKNPTYEEVCTDTTNHIEVCKLEFDEKVVSFKDLLKVFWKIHDPTQLGGQGPDIGSQYTSVIFYLSNKQKEEAIKSKEFLEKEIGKKVVTKILKAKVFYKAEEYHQKYLLKKGKTSC